MGKINFASQIN